MFAYTVPDGSNPKPFDQSSFNVREWTITAALVLIDLCCTRPAAI